jgi:phage terminase large subunit-like protein
MICVTTPGLRYDTSGGDSIAYLLYQYGRRVASGEVVDPTFYLAAWEAPAGAAVDDEAGWEAANPGLDIILDRSELAAQAHKAMAGGMDEAEFRVKRLAQWVTTNRTWFPPGGWDRAARPERVVDTKEPIVLGFDGAWTNDSIALVGCTVNDAHLFVVDSWERPLDDPHYRADSRDVDRVLREALVRYNVLEVAADPHEWRAQIADWAEGGIPVHDWPTNSLPRIAPATKEFYTAIMERRLTHDGDPRLARHIINATIKEDRFGVRITKEHRGSPRKIDLAVASIIAYDRSRFHVDDRPPKVAFYA